MKQHFHVKSKDVDDTFPLYRICADIAKSTRERPAQKLGPKIINPMTNSFTLNMHETRRWLEITVSRHLDTS